MYRTILLWCVLFFCLFFGVSHAQSLTTKTTGNLLEVTATYPFGSFGQTKLYVSRTPLGSVGSKTRAAHAQEVASVIHTSTERSFSGIPIVFLVSDLPLGETLYVNAVSIVGDSVQWLNTQGGESIKTEEKPNFVVNLNPLVVSQNSFKASGVIDTRIHTNFKDFKFTYYITDATGGIGNPFRTIIAPVNDQGVFSTPENTGINNLDATKIYTVILKIQSPGGAVDTSLTQQFSKEKGFILPVTTEEGRAAYDAQTYRLLAPLPGLSMIRDTALCLDYKASIAAQGGDTEDIVCDINDFLNFLMKMLIAISAVVLIVRLIIAGFSYMLTDVPFIKVSSKGQIMTALGGLALALGAWVLLNTINPRLVSGSIQLDGVEFAVEEVRERANDEEFVSNLGRMDTSGITVGPELYTNDAFLGYLAHQQGSAGAAIILWAAKNNYQTIPERNPIHPSVRGSTITRNMSNNFPRADARKVIGTSVLTPSSFVQYWGTRVVAARRMTNPVIPPFIQTPLEQVGRELSIPIEQLQAMCRIEAAAGCTTQVSLTTVNKFGYAGLFQLSNAVHQRGKKGVWETYRKTNNDALLLDAYHNAYAGAKYYLDNLAQIKRAMSRF